MSGLIVYGDPHGEWRPLFRACENDPPEAVIILGDLDLDVPFRERLWPLLERGIRTLWIVGNHDKDSEVRHDHLFGYPEGCLGARPVIAGGIRAAGLGGVFKEKVWYPRFAHADPVHASRASFMRSLTKTDRWRRGLPLKLRDAIFPEDVTAMSGARVDLLVTHEAPSSHKHGFVGVDRAAELCRARLVVHGHHHESVHGQLPGGVPVRGLAKAEVLRLSPGNVP